MAPKEPKKAKKAAALIPATRPGDRLLLLPYIALGWVPVNTPGSGLMCGFHALSLAINYVQSMIDPTGTDSFITFDEIRNIRRSKSFTDDVVAWSLVHNVPTKIIEKHLKEKSFYTDDFLELMLAQINIKRGTRFRLGVVASASKQKIGLPKKPKVEDIPPNARVFGDKDEVGPIIWLFHSGTYSG